MKFMTIVGALAVLVSVPAPAQEVADQMAAARAHLAAHNLDSAATIFRRVAEASAASKTDRIQAWVMLGIVDYYRTGDSATAEAFRRALALDPGFAVPSLAQYDPAIAGILAAQRGALPARAVAPTSQGEPVYDCLNRCPAGVVAPQFVSFPHVEITDASVGVYDRRSRTFLQFEAVITPDGLVEPETMIVAGGTARGTEAELRRALMQARFSPGRADGVPVRARVRVRFDFESEGTSWVKYTYRVTAR